MNTENNIHINLEFFRAKSLSKQEKIKEFWKFLDNQDILKPYEVPKSEKLDSSTTNATSIHLSSSSNNNRCSPSTCSCNTKTSSDSKPTMLKPTQKTKKEKKEKNCDGETSKLEKYLREDLRYADSVPVPYEDLIAEIEEFERRLLCGCKNKTCSCKTKTSAYESPQEPNLN